MSSLMHHGVKGQRWGVRRFQNEDGSLTPLGEKRIKKLKKIGDKRNKQQASLYGQSNLYSAKSIQPIFGKFKNLDSETEVLKAGAKINRIATENEPLDDKRKYVSFTSGDNAKYKFFAEVKELGLPKDAEPYAYQFRAIKDIRIANGKAIESFIVNDIKATSTSKKQKEEAKKIIEAFDKHLDNEAIIQGASKVLEKAMSVKEGSDNHFYKEAGIKANDQIDLYRNTIKTYLEGDPKKVEKLADHLRSRGYDAYLDIVDARSSVRWKYGTDYPLIMMSPKDNMELVKSEKLKHTSIGGTMYIEGNTLIFGDSSYLEHHGIRGQKWGVRRFQNKNGSLTNAGRKRLGYATKGVGATAKKVFNAGVKTGTAVGKAGVKAAKDIKSIHDDSKAKHLEKVKQKVSKTRAGVYANKNLFDANELKALNTKFDEQDKLKMDKLKKGMEVAKLLSAYAGAAKGIGDAYQSITGENILTTVTTMKANKQAKAQTTSTNKNEAKKKLQENIERYRQAKAAEGRKIAKNKKLQQYIDQYNAYKAQRDAEEAARKLLRNYKLQQYIDQYNASLTQDAFEIQNGVLFIDSSISLTHHGVSGQKWGVRRFQNADGSLTPKGRKHYEQAIAKIDRKQTHSDALRGRLERQHPFAVTGATILGAVATGMTIAATGGASIPMIAAGSAIAGAVSAGMTHAGYSVNETWEARGTRGRQKKRKEYEEMLKHDAFSISDGTLYLPHHGIRG